MLRLLERSRIHTASAKKKVNERNDLATRAMLALTKQLTANYLTEHAKFVHGVPTRHRIASFSFVDG
jgi:hypothetical protein